MDAVAPQRLGHSRGCNRQRGAAAIEYALIAALVAVVVVGSVTQTGMSVLALFTDIATQVACATGGVGC